MLKKILPAVFLLSSSFFTFSQTNKCGSAEYLKKLQTTNPAEYEAIMATDLETRKLAESKSTYKLSGEIYEIPVVVHVVYDSAFPAQNIIDEMIISQIEVLNEDFRRLNADASETPAEFADVAADAEIQFCLAQTDPDGNPTTGITRTITDVNFWYKPGNSETDLKDSDDGGIDGWPRDSYLNIWICNLVGGVLGWATFPGGIASRDGIVIGYEYFGDGSPGAPYDKGRTATHEIGHWLGLYHIWGDDGGSCSGDDSIDDTPEQGGANYSCPNFPSMDACTLAPPGVMFMNYMDYTDDDCMNMFTEGQATKMRSTLEGSRDDILISEGCNAQVAVNDILSKQLLQITIYPNPASTQFEVAIKNFDGNEVTIQIYNMMGQVMKSVQTSNSGDQHVTLDASHFPAGEYLVKVSDGNEILTQQLSVAK